MATDSGTATVLKIIACPERQLIYKEDGDTTLPYPYVGAHLVLSVSFSDPVDVLMKHSCQVKLSFISISLQL